MNNTIKIVLSISLQGRLSHETREEKISWEKSTKDNLNIIVARGVCTNNYRIPMVAFKNIKISEEAYDTFVSNAIIPSNYQPRKFGGKTWKNLSINEKISFHCSQISGDNSFTFEILE